MLGMRKSGLGMEEVKKCCTRWIPIDLNQREWDLLICEELKKHASLISWATMPFKLWKASEKPNRECVQRVPWQLNLIRSIQVLCKSADRDPKAHLIGCAPCLWRLQSHQYLIIRFALPVNHGTSSRYVLNACSPIVIIRSKLTFASSSGHEI